MYYLVYELIEIIKGCWCSEEICKDTQLYITSLGKLVACFTHYSHSIDVFCLCLNVQTQMQAAAQISF